MAFSAAGKRPNRLISTTAGCLTSSTNPSEPMSGMGGAGSHRPALAGPWGPEGDRDYGHHRIHTGFRPVGPAFKGGSPIGQDGRPVSMPGAGFARGPEREREKPAPALNLGCHLWYGARVLRGRGRLFPGHRGDTSIIKIMGGV